MRFFSYSDKPYDEMAAVERTAGLAAGSFWSPLILFKPPLSWSSSQDDEMAAVERTAGLAAGSFWLPSSMDRDTWSGASACMFSLVPKGFVSRVGAALENFPAQKRKKSFGSTYTKKNRSEKNVTKHHEAQFVHPQNRRFPLSTMVANIHLRSLFCNVNIAYSRL
jgi:hypothetical protein